MTSLLIFISYLGYLNEIKRNNAKIANVLKIADRDPLESIRKKPIPKGIYDKLFIKKSVAG